jgi:hypothetical protein
MSYDIYRNTNTLLADNYKGSFIVSHVSQEVIYTLQWTLDYTVLPQKKLKLEAHLHVHATGGDNLQAEASKNAPTS